MRKFAPTEWRDERPAPGRGFTVTELVVVVCIVATLVAISVVGIARAKRSKDQVGCINNLHAIGIGFATYGVDNGDFFPPPNPALQWEDILRPYVARQSFQCPADNELFVALGSSYDWRDTGNPQTTLAGKMHLQLARNNVSLAFDTLPGWHGSDTVDVLNVDQSVQLTSQEAFFKELQQAPDKP